MTRCPGCFKPEQATYCGACRKRLFGVKKVPFILPFSRPAYDQVKLGVTTDRMSISGIQTKISLALNAGRLEMVMSGGQYILKPRPHGTFKRLDMVPINEHLTMQIARQVFKIEVAENALVAFEDGELAYLVRRFDVQPDGQRSLQEDFAQIAARTEEAHGMNYKYDSSYEEIGQLIRRHVAASPVDLERFFTLVAFNYLVNNGDAHLKNFSLIKNEQADEYNLTPAYDLLNTRLHLPDETQTALELFKDGFETESYKANAYYAYDDFVEFAQRLGLVERRYKRILEMFISKQEAVFSLIECSMLSEECKNLYKKHVNDRISAFSYSLAGLRI
ncbi:HipA domain-containing protein [Singulisphaera sp. Ch08]|uniref:HipA domain-containing protein n=1 Tax=Singulisphaera sp. Ch08 TaxID=3120278 RepID=A0AAU7CK67_9BACT